MCSVSLRKRFHVYWEYMRDILWNFELLNARNTSAQGQIGNTCDVEIESSLTFIQMDLNVNYVNNSAERRSCCVSICNYIDEQEMYKLSDSLWKAKTCVFNCIYNANRLIKSINADIRSVMIVTELAVRIAKIEGIVARRSKTVDEDWDRWIPRAG